MSQTNTPPCIRYASLRVTRSTCYPDINLQPRLYDQSTVPAGFHVVRSPCSFLTDTPIAVVCNSLKFTLNLDNRSTIIFASLDLSPIRPAMGRSNVTRAFSGPGSENQRSKNVWNVPHRHAVGREATVRVQFTCVGYAIHSAARSCFARRDMVVSRHHLRLSSRDGPVD